MSKLFLLLRIFFLINCESYVYPNIVVFPLTILSLEQQNPFIKYDSVTIRDNDLVFKPEGSGSNDDESKNENDEKK